MKMRNALFLLTLVAAAAVARGEDTEATLKARFEQRYPHLAELKAAGTVGETTAGYIDFVKPGSGDAAAQDFLRAENDDRSQLYKLLAAKDATTADKVAVINARRRFERAKPGEWLKGEDGKWKQKS